MALYPRADIDQAGLAPLTSMFFFDVNDRVGVDDYREAVHDSNGLQLRTGQDEWIWRPLTNPRNLQISAFSDASPRGFGLMQRAAELRRLPGPGGELPEAARTVGGADRRLGPGRGGTGGDPHRPGGERQHRRLLAPARSAEGQAASILLNYRLHWCWAAPADVPLGAVMQTRTGLSWDTKHRQFVIDFVGPALQAWQDKSPPGSRCRLRQGQDRARSGGAESEYRWLAHQHRARSAGQQGG